MSPSTNMKSDKVSYVLKPNYLQVTIKGEPFALDSTHPTFKRLAEALRSKNWKMVPKLVNIAQSLMNDSQGNIEVKKGVVFYKGREIKSTLTSRIIDILKSGKDVRYMLKFMDNLYQNPSHEAINEFYGW